MNEDVAQDVKRVMQKIYSAPPGAKDQEPEVEEEVIHVHHFPDALVIIKEPAKGPSTNIPVVESTPTPDHADKNSRSMFTAYLAVTTFIFLIFSSIIFQVYLLLYPPTTTITLLLKSEQISLNGTLQLGRVLSPITISQSATANTTGHGHQDARAATGAITFYNGLFSEQTVAAGTILTGSDGVQIVTGKDAVIPAATPNPLAFGYVTVAAQATSTGSRGNISAYDINETCCSSGILAKNTIPFHGGQDERDFQFVTKTDINNTASPLKTTLSQSVNGALQGQLKTNESLITPSCTTATTSDHHAGEEAATVKVTVSETCSAVAANTDALNTKVTDLLDYQAAKKLGSGYSLLGNPQITVTSAAGTKQVMLSFNAQSTWVYALSSTEQQNIKKIVAGKTQQKALQYLLSLHEIESASIQWSGFTDNTRLPRNIEWIHFQLIIGI